MVFLGLFLSQSRMRTAVGLRRLLDYRRISTTVSLAEQATVGTRESMDVDVCIVGAGPAGLSAAIRLKQLCKEKGQDLSVCVLEKGSEVGAHILSGNVFEPRALNELLPAWREEGAPLDTPVSKDYFYWFTRKSAWRLPLPPPMHNNGNFIISLSQLTRWLAGKAEELGVDIFPGFAASQVLYSGTGGVAGVATNDFGVGKDGKPKDNYSPGMDLRARLTLFAEGCRGSLSQAVMKRYRLREEAGVGPQTYGLGLKEMWQIAPEKSRAGEVWHVIGWPLAGSVYGGGWMYHMKDNMLSLGYVVGLDYRNPWLSPFQEFQRWKQHPKIRQVLEGGTCVQYGARSLNEGGLQAIPKLTFPGGALVGDAAGFLNVPKIKGTHTAMKSGMVAAEAAFAALQAQSRPNRDVDMSAYQSSMEESWVWEELRLVRNIRPAFHWGVLPGLTLSALDTYLFQGEAPWTLKYRYSDHERLYPASEAERIEYPPPDGKISFDLASSLYRSGTNHNHDQPVHLRLGSPTLPAVVNLPLYGGPEARYCPAGVYEYVKDEQGVPQLHINAQNCLHCKACDIKDPNQNIHWTVPEGGGGPAYTIM